MRYFSPAVPLALALFIGLSVGAVRGYQIGGQGDETAGGARGGSATVPVNTPPSAGLLLLGGIGGLLPTVLRVLTWARTPIEERGVSPFSDVGIWISTLILIGLGVLAAWLLDPASKVQAVAFGYSAPEFLTRAITAAQGKQPSDRSATFERRPTVSIGRVLDWWAL